ncbi:MAG: hypothetical protein K8S97_05955 [Anaerolineae bacterium]|nr:hypothetical protein [Anaerolineae bacterium]
MNKRLFCALTGLLLAIILLSVPGLSVRAQDGGDGDDPVEDTLILLNADPAIPTLIQAINPDDPPDYLRLARRITLTAEEQAATPLIYVAVANTGWSAGAVGVISDLLNANGTYVVAEVRDRGMAGYAVREDGQGLVFDLVYEPDLDAVGVPGFRFDVLIGQPRTFRIFRVVEDGGLLLLVKTSVLTNAGREQERRQVVIDPDPVFGDLLFEFHIEALPEVIDTPDEDDADEGDDLEDADGDGVLDADDACPDAWGSLPNGCVGDWEPGGEDGASPEATEEPEAPPPPPPPIDGG